MDETNLPGVDLSLSKPMNHYAWDSGFLKAASRNIAGRVCELVRSVVRVRDGQV